MYFFTFSAIAASEISSFTIEQKEYTDSECHSGSLYGGWLGSGNSGNYASSGNAFHGLAGSDSLYSNIFY